MGTALAFGAHPDDVELQAGGTLAGLGGAGGAGRAGLLHRRGEGQGRPQPTRPSWPACGGPRPTRPPGCCAAVPVHFLGAVDGELEVTMALRLAVARLVRVVRPDVVLGHDPWRHSLLHPDHRAAGLLTVDGVVAARDPLYAPELAAQGLAAHRPHTVLLFGTDAPDELVEVTAAMDAKLASLRAHASQITDHADLERRIRTWNAAIGAGAGLQYAEAFHTLDTRGR